MRTGIAAGLSVFKLFFSCPAAADTAAVAAAAAAAGAGPRDRGQKGPETKARLVAGRRETGAQRFPADRSQEGEARRQKVRRWGNWKLDARDCQETGNRIHETWGRGFILFAC